MEDLIKRNFESTRQALNTMSARIDNQDKKISDYNKTIQMQQATINTLQQEIVMLKAKGYSTGPTVNG